MFDHTPCFWLGNILHNNSLFSDLTLCSPAKLGSWRKNDCCFCCCNPQELTFTFGLSLPHTYFTKLYLLCVCYLCVMISALSYSGWKWLMYLQYHALALGVPQESWTEPRFVTVGFTGCSWGTVELITGLGFHCFRISSWFKWRGTGETLMRVFWVGGQGQCACVSMC